MVEDLLLPLTDTDDGANALAAAAPPASPMDAHRCAVAGTQRIVAGGYGRSRLRQRQRPLGSVNREMRQSTTLPLLFPR